MRPPKVLRVSHVGRCVNDLERARNFYELLGFVVEEVSGGTMYLKGVEESQHHSLAIKECGDSGLLYIAFRVTDPEELDIAREYYSSMGYKVYKFSEKAVSDAIVVEKDPLGFPIALYYDMEYTGDYRMKYYLHRGAPPLRLDHVTIVVPRREMVDIASKYIVKDLGFLLTEYVEDDHGTIALFVSKQQKPHDMAIFYMDGIHGHHHVAYYVRDAKDIFRVADVLGSAEFYDSIEVGPGRHGAAQAYYFYVRDPSGGRVELMTDNYLILDPDKWRPVRWRVSYRGTYDYWGRTHIFTEYFLKNVLKIMSPI
jgi:catechol 2,3-dioxygenase